MTSINLLVSTLCKDQTPRVWSLLVAVFGELGQETSVKISGTLLGHLTGLMGIKPEATRVALHRLKKEGWLQSEKVGRKSNYFLSAKARKKSAEATPLIYGHIPPSNTAWVVQFDPSAPITTRDHSGVWLASHILITPHTTDHATALTSQIGDTQDVPDWVRRKMCDPALAQYAQTLLRNLNALETDLARAPDLSPLEIAGLRILIVQAWRRIALRAPNLANRFFPSDWAGDPCRKSVSDILGQLPQQDLASLERAATAIR